MPARLLHRMIARGRAVVHRLQCQLMAATRPAVVPIVTGAVVDLARSEPAVKDRGYWLFRSFAA